MVGRHGGREVWLLEQEAERSQEAEQTGGVAYWQELWPTMFKVLGSIAGSLQNMLSECLPKVMLFFYLPSISLPNTLTLSTVHKSICL